MTARTRLLPLVFIALSAAPLSAQTTTRVSVDSTGAQGNDVSGQPSISSDGRYVGFQSKAALAPGAAPGLNSIFVHDRQTGQTVCASVGLGGVPATDDSFVARMSSDGTRVAFYSESSNLVVGDTNAFGDIFVRDLVAGTTTRVNVNTAGAEGNTRCNPHCAISADGRVIAFQSSSTNLPWGTMSHEHVYVRDTLTSVTTLVSATSSGSPASGGGRFPWISGDGRYVLFHSNSFNLVPNDTSPYEDVYLRDRQTGQTTRVSLGLGGVQSDDHSYASTMSGDGRWLVFKSAATNLVANDTNNFEDLFRRDRLTGENVLVSCDSNGVSGSSFVWSSSISADGRYVSFVSRSATLVQGDTNNRDDTFVRDCLTGTTNRISVTNAGAQSSESAGGTCSISSDGRLIAFDHAGALVSNDTNSAFDVYVRDLGAIATTPFCLGDGSQTTACPCGNTGATGRGCENSAATGGAQLVISGFAGDPNFATMQATGVVPGALSIFVQSTAPLARTTFGDGVRCFGGVLNRMYVATAVGDTAHAPTPGSRPLGAQSAYLEDPIVPGTSRWYQVWYRDAVLSFCAAPLGDAWNLSSGVRVDW